MQPQTPTDYKQLLTDVIKKQIVILGPDITLSKARNVKGITVADDGTVTNVVGSSQEVTQALIDQFVQLSGLIVKKTMEPLLSLSQPVAPTATPEEPLPSPVATTAVEAQAVSTPIAQPINTAAVGQPAPEAHQPFTEVPAVSPTPPPEVSPTTPTTPTAQQEPSVVAMPTKNPLAA